MRAPPIFAALVLAACGDSEPLVAPPTPIAVPLEIFEFSANPTVMMEGWPITLTWTTAGAERVRISRRGHTIASYQGRLVAHGSAQVLASNGPTTYRLEASNSAETVASELVVEELGRPQIALFRTSPSAAIGTSTTATIEWATEDAASVELYAGGVKVLEFPGTASGTWSFTARVEELIQLVANGPTGYAARENAIIAAIPSEHEPNDSIMRSNDITRALTAYALLGSDDDVDFFLVRSSARISAIRAWIDDGYDGCLVDTELALYHYPPVELGKVAGGGLPTERGGSCALLDPDVHDFAHDLGTEVYLRVSSPTEELGRYVIHVEVIE